jgi:hypothetical protein
MARKWAAGLGRPLAADGSCAVVLEDGARVRFRERRHAREDGLVAIDARPPAAAGPAGGGVGDGPAEAGLEIDLLGVRVRMGLNAGLLPAVAARPAAVPSKL